MGVSGLLPVLKPIQEATTLERYRGKTLAIDTYAWLHKASFCCAEDLVLERPTKAYINYFNKRIQMLRHFNIKPYFVFDGDYLPSKGNTEKEREIRRNEYKQLAIEAKKTGNSKLAFNYYQKACDISPEMAKSVINELKIKFIKYIVAPYEADSQMVMLEKLGLVDGIISEDSDLLIFGCKTLITKLNDKGQCIEIKRDNFNKCKGSYINNFNDDQLLLMATISGCDYTKGIPGIGIQKAIQLTQFYKTYERVLMSIKVEGKNIPNEFEEEFKRAKIAFRHQIVFNPIDNLAQHLNPLPEEIVSNYSKEYIQSCTGFILEDEIHKKISIGELDPFSKKVLISWECKVNTNLNRSVSLSLPIENNNSNNHSLSKNMIYRSKTENIIQSKGVEVQPILNKKRKSTFKIDQFAKFISNKRENNNNNNNNDLNNGKLSPISKRQKLLNNNEIGQPTISKFFNNNNNDSNNNDEKDKIKIRTEEFTASSSDVEDITEEEINEFNMKLNESIGYKNKNKNDSSDIKLSESDEDAGETDNDNFLPSETEIGDIDLINSSEISESTITTMDKAVNKHTPISLMMNNSSISLNTDPGDVNIECYIDEDLTDKGVMNDNEVEDISEDHIVDKSNLLAEIYSFKSVKATNITASTKKNILNDENKQYNTTITTNNSKPFAPNKWMDRLSGIRNNKVHRPSPLNKRIPLQDVTTNVNVNSNNTTTPLNNTKEKENNISSTNNLSSFRYTGR
jgi:exonuclease-1